MTPKPQDPAPTGEARELARKINNLRDHYEPGADGGMYHALHPDALKLIDSALGAAKKFAREEVKDRDEYIRRLEREQLVALEAAREEERERCAEIADGWRVGGIAPYVSNTASAIVEAIRSRPTPKAPEGAPEYRALTEAREREEKNIFVPTGKVEIRRINSYDGRAHSCDGPDCNCWTVR